MVSKQNDCAVYNSACCRDDLLLLSIKATDVQQQVGVRDSGFPPCMNWLQATDYLLHVVRSRRASELLHRIPSPTEL